VIGELAFQDCLSLISVCIPARVEEIPSNCFIVCLSLTHLLFESGAKAVRIRFGALGHCHSLHFLAIPAQLEIMDFGALFGCESLRELIFETPSSLKQLELPGSDFGSLLIPDSVEVVCGTIGSFNCQSRALQFGRESRLSEIHLEEFGNTGPPDRSSPEKKFLFVFWKKYCEDFDVSLKVCDGGRKQKPNSG
jgi:hypothetical protein